jgi:hypothetical protein
MDILSFTTLAGMIGGSANELLHWYGLRRSIELPVYARQPIYWIITLAMIFLGGFFASLQLGPGAEPLLAFELGILFPLALKKIVSNGAADLVPMGGSFKWNHIARFLKG